jgi:hypothetical protein
VVHRRLFVAELGNDTVGVIDVDARRVVRRHAVRSQRRRW